MSTRNLPWRDAERFNQAAARYTSYPTVPHWSASEPAVVADVIDGVRASRRPLAVYVHLPFCASMCAYCGCNVVVARSYEPIAPYLAMLERELDAWRSIVGPRPLVQLHLGGGTPTLLRPADLRHLIAGITRRFPAAAELEIGVEADPGTVTREHLVALVEVGATRLSVGVQDFDSGVLAKVGRPGRGELARRAMGDALELGFASVNADLMYGLPGQTPEHMAANADTLRELGVHRAAVFGYAHVPHLRPHQRRLEQYDLPEPAARWELLTTARQAFEANGYCAIGLDHYALADDALATSAAAGTLRRNFQGYTTLGDADLVGVGASAVSDFGDAYLQNHHRVSRYRDAVSTGLLDRERVCLLSADDRLRRQVIFDLMCNLRVHPRDYDVDFDGYFASELESLRPLMQAGCVEIDADAIVVPEAARPLLRTIAKVFDAHEQRKHFAAAAAV